MLDLISPEYAEQNRLLHEDDKKYGSGSWRWAQKIEELREKTESHTILDYGCGKGNMKIALSRPELISEYDPGIPGKDAEPKPADMVICTDVLEHIEPDKIDDVLKHISKLARRAVFIVIATRPSKKTLRDGRNAHLLVRSAEWWKEKLEKRFFIATWSPDGDEVVMTGATIKELGTVIAKSAVADDLRLNQALRNCALVKDRVGEQPRHDGRVVIVAYGPSLAHTWRTIATERKAFGAKIVTVSGAHDFLIERGIVPDYHIEVDPREHKAFFTKNSHPDVTYWIASCCHPKLIDNLIENNRKLALWHVYNSDMDRKIVDDGGPDPGGWLICGGGSVGCRSVNVMYTQGYRTFSVYGMDCSFTPDGDQHAGAHSGKPHHDWNIRIGNRWFRSSANLVYTARGFIQNFKVLRQASAANNEPLVDGSDSHVELYLHGDGLLANMVNAISESEQKAA